MRMLMVTFTLLGLLAAPALAAAPAPAPAPAAPAPAAGGLETYASRHGFSVDYPKGWVLEPFAEEQETLETGIGNPAIFHLYNYDPQNVADPGAPVPSDKIKLEALVARPDAKSLDEWVGRLPKVKSARDLTLAAGPAKEIENEELDAESGGVIPCRRIIVLTKELMVEFHYFPPDTKEKAAFDAIVASFRTAPAPGSGRGTKK